jgi:hypothetical protein
MSQIIEDWEIEMDNKLLKILKTLKISINLIRRKESMKLECG